MTNSLSVYTCMEGPQIKNRSDSFPARCLDTSLNVQGRIHRGFSGVLEPLFCQELFHFHGDFDENLEIPWGFD